MKWLVIALLLSTAVFAQTIADYPYVFFKDRSFDAYIIKGDIRAPDENIASNLVINSLPKFYRPVFRVYGGFNYNIMRADQNTVKNSVRTASQIPVLDKPSILIGTPCTNEWIRKVLDAENCNILPADTGLVLLGLHQGQLVLIVSGGSPKMVLQSAKWLNSEAHFRHFAQIALLRNRQVKTQLGKGEILSVGKPVGQLGAVIAVSQDKAETTGVGSYVRFPGGRVIYGER